MRIQNMTLALAMVGSVLGPLAAAPANAAAKLYATTSTAGVNLPTAGSVPTTILTLKVPAGSWLVTAKADVVNFTAGDFERCGIDAGSALVDQSTGTTTPSSGVVNIKSQGAITVSSSTVLTLYCQHDFNVSAESVDPNAQLIAEKVPGIIRQ